MSAHCLHKGRGLPDERSPGEDFFWCCHHLSWETLSDDYHPPRTGLRDLLATKVPAGWMLVACACSTFGAVILTRFWVAYL